MDHVRAVREGMELLSWDCTPTMWRVHLENEMLLDAPSDEDFRKAGAFIFIELAFAAIRDGWRTLRGTSPRDNPPRVLFTSTGALVGDTPWLWQWLFWLPPPRVCPGSHHIPPVLELTFSRPWRPRQAVRVPIPEQLVDATRELVQHLRERLVGRMDVTARSAPRPPKA